MLRVRFRERVGCARKRGMGMSMSVHVARAVHREKGEWGCRATSRVSPRVALGPSRAIRRPTGHYRMLARKPHDTGTSVPSHLQ